MGAGKRGRLCWVDAERCRQRIVGTVAHHVAMVAGEGAGWGAWVAPDGELGCRKPAATDRGCRSSAPPQGGR
jgi:hypothetical protein